VGLSAGLDAVGRDISLVPALNRTVIPRSSPCPSHYTDLAIPKCGRGKKMKTISLMWMEEEKEKVEEGRRGNILRTRS
jgi:hypothetical protein